MSVPVNSIDIPHEFKVICGNWYYGMGDMMYAVYSTGGLSLGDIRPEYGFTDEQWYLQLWRDLSCDIGYARRAAGKCGHEDFPKLVRFEKWVDDTCEQLTEAYGLQNWERD
jgi:hypothetical protein